MAELRRSTSTSVLLTSTLVVGALLMFLSGGVMSQPGDWWTKSGNDIYNNNTGNVGIGTGSTPAGTLHVKGGYVITERTFGGQTIGGPQGTIQAGLSNGVFQVGAGPSLLFYASDSVQNKEFLGRVSTLWEDPSNGAEKASLAFSVRANAADTTASTERMRILANGNVGIGTQNPSTKLHVQGDVTVSGNIAAKYQDLAEWVPSRHHFPAGTVVVIDPLDPYHIVASSSAYDTRVAGVISEHPGVILGEAGKDRLMVATTGRVRVKVDATAAPIRIGDLLVTSDAPGLAMKSKALSISGAELHRPGTVLGKALEPLDGGRGTVLVLLSLQ